jgi:hypothetical protein
VTGRGDTLEERVILLSECRAVSVKYRTLTQYVIGEVGICWIPAAEYRRSVIREIGFFRISELICNGVACNLAEAWFKFEVVNSEKRLLFPAGFWLQIGISAEKLLCPAEYPSWKIFQKTCQPLSGFPIKAYFLLLQCQLLQK